MSKIEGYWYSEQEPHFPVPVPNILSDEEALIIFNLIKKKEKSATLLRFKGISRSRIDKSSVGSCEYLTSKYNWPQGFAEHYVLKYKVRPSEDFLKYIGYLTK